MRAQTRLVLSGGLVAGLTGWEIGVGSLAAAVLEDFCVVTESVRRGIDVRVAVEVDAAPAQPVAAGGSPGTVCRS